MESRRSIGDRFGNPSKFEDACARCHCFFAKKGTHVHSAVRGVVLYSGSIKTGGKVVLILGPKWRLHYYAHLDQITTAPYGFVSQNTQIGTVGNSGNAIGKPAHLHYSIFTLLPYPWRIDSSPQGWKKNAFICCNRKYTLENLSRHQIISML